MDPREPEFTRRSVDKALEAFDKGLREDRDLLPFELNTELAVRRLIEFLNSGKIKVRRREGKFLHAKAFIFRGSERGFLSGSSNLTSAGLRHNLELNIGHYDVPLSIKLESWYEELWEESDPYDLAAIYEEMLKEYSPYLIYLKVLWHLYGEELLDEKETTGDIPVTTFQKHGVYRALKIIEDYGGVLIADGVGLGKTYLAGDIITKYRDEKKRVLLICPASLRDSSWAEFIHRYSLFVDCVSYEQLALDRQFDGDSTHLRSEIEEYSLVVIDEAHNYRNPDAPTRAGVLRRLMVGRRPDLLLMSATPVNNSLWDLFHLLRFFIKQDAILAHRGVRSIRERFETATKIDPFDLNPDLLYPIIDATTVKRTRAFVKKYYENDSIRDSTGKLVPIRFPNPNASTIKYSLEESLPGMIDKLEEALMPETGSPLLRFARYQVKSYSNGHDPEDQDSSLIGLIRSALLKRFESSVYAFCRTIGRMVRQHEVFLDGLENGIVYAKEFLREVSAAEDEVELEELLEGKIQQKNADNYNIEALKRDVTSDLFVLKDLLNSASNVETADRPKLQALADELAKISELAKETAIDSEEERQNRKVLVFSFYEDTIDWMDEFLTAALETDERLKPYRGRVASVSGRDSRNEIRREAAVYGFAPVSTKAPPGKGDDLYDLLLTTDVLAEGMNLQQCRNVINFDLPWNPMRLVQRHGRIDRIGSPHKDVYLRTFFPDEELNRLLQLEERIRRKLAQAAATVGVETSPIEQGATGDQSFTNTRGEIDKLLNENPELFELGSTISASQSGEEYRQELRIAIKSNQKEIEQLPWQARSGMVKGDEKGHFFCATIGDRTYLRFVPLGKGDESIVSELGSCLRLIECTPDTECHIPTDIAESAYSAWDRARKHIYESWQFETDPLNLQPEVRKLNREVAAFLRENPPTNVEENRLTECLEAVESPWSRREENQLRKVWNDESSSEADKSVALVKEIEKIGVEPYQAPDPLPPIDEDEVHLICWMGITAEQKF